MRSKKTGLFTRVLCIIFVSVLVLSAAACNRTEKAKEKSSTVFVDENLTILSQYGRPDHNLLQYASDVEKFGNGICDGTEVTDDGVRIYFEEENRKAWQDRIEEAIAVHQDQFAAMGDDYRISVSKDMAAVEFYYSPGIRLNESGEAITQTIYLSGLYQLFSGADQWQVNVRIINSDTGITVAEGRADEAHDQWIEYDNSDWLASYPEDAVLLYYGKSFASYFGTNVQDLYERMHSLRDCCTSVLVLYDVESDSREQDPVLLVYTSDEKDAVLQAISADAKDQADAFQKQAGEKYKIEYGNDFASLDIWYDAGVSDDISIPFVDNAAINAALYRSIASDSTDNWSVKLTIHEARTGEIVMEETLPEDDFRIIGQDWWKN